MKLLTIALGTLVLVSACANQTPVATSCEVNLSNKLVSAIHEVEDRLASGCTYHFDAYFQQLMKVAEENAAPENKQLFSEHLVRVSNAGVINKRQAKALYNRYFNVKFVAFTGDYNTCSQACPVHNELVSNMRHELKDKERGLMHASLDQGSYYRADLLMKEAQLVLEATCRACANGPQH